MNHHVYAPAAHKPVSFSIRVSQTCLFEHLSPKYKHSVRTQTSHFDDPITTKMDTVGSGVKTGGSYGCNLIRWVRMGRWVVPMDAIWCSYGCNLTKLGRMGIRLVDRDALWGRCTGRVKGWFLWMHVVELVAKGCAGGFAQAYLNGVVQVDVAVVSIVRTLYEEERW